MTIDWQQLAANAVSGIAIAMLSAGLTARWALARFRSERWWERKASAYTDIARALFLMKRYVDDYIAANDNGYTRTKEFQKALADDRHAGARAVEEATALGAFIVSPEAAGVLDQLRIERDRAGEEEDNYGKADIEAAALDRAIKGLTAAARRDLGVAPADTGEPGVHTAMTRPR